MSLQAMARTGKWPTPTVQDGENTAGPAQFRRNSLPLNAMVKVIDEEERAADSKWPTPTMGDWKSSGSRNLEAETAKKGNLNPDWVEWLMGWPVGWTRDTPIVVDEKDPYWDMAWEQDPHYDGTAPRVAVVEKRTHRLKATGNGQVPQTLVLAWETLTGAS